MEADLPHPHITPLLHHTFPRPSVKCMHGINHIIEWPDITQMMVTWVPPAHAWVVGLQHGTMECHKRLLHEKGSAMLPTWLRESGKSMLRGEPGRSATLFTSLYTFIHIADYTRYCTACYTVPMQLIQSWSLYRFTNTRIDMIMRPSAP